VRKKKISKNGFDSLDRDSQPDYMHDEV